MKIQEIKEIAKQHGIKAIAVKNLKKDELVRTIQAGEGNEVCFNTGNSKQCGQDSCLWRDDCS